MNARPRAWLFQAENDLQMASLALEHGFFSLGATPPAELFDRTDAQQAIAMAGRC